MVGLAESDSDIHLICFNRITVTNNYNKYYPVWKKQRLNQYTWNKVLTCTCSRLCVLKVSLKQGDILSCSVVLLAETVVLLGV